MKQTQSILAGLAMLLFSFSLKGEIITTILDHSIIAQTDKKGVTGYRGCDLKTAKKLPAYTFELQIKSNNKYATCSVGSVGRWTPFLRKHSDDGSAVFENIPDGKYRIICLSAQAIGCEVTGDVNGLPKRSIVFEKEISNVINLNAEAAKQVFDDTNIPFENNALKVFPNPAKDEITVQLENEIMEEEITLSLVNLLGEILESKTYPLTKTTSLYIWTINLRQYPSGAYFISLIDTNGQTLQSKILLAKE